MRTLRLYIIDLKVINHQWLFGYLAVNGYFHKAKACCSKTPNRHTKSAHTLKRIGGYSKYETGRNTLKKCQKRLAIIWPPEVRKKISTF